MSMFRIDLTGHTYGRLTVVGNPRQLPRDRESGRMVWHWDCRCSCDEKIIVANSERLRTGKTRSCGCIVLERCKLGINKGKTVERVLSKIQKKQIIVDYKRGMSCPKIAKALGLNQSSIWDHIKKNGVLIRGKRECNRRYHLNHDAFCSPLSEEAAYWVGMLMADGCIGHNGKDGSGRVITLSLKASDSEHVRKFAAFVKTNQPPKLTTRKSGYGLENGTGMYRITISSIKMANDLEKWGVVPRKSVVASPSNGLECSASFWRGMVDGDGWVSPGKPRIGLCGSLDCVSKFKTYVSDICGRQFGDLRKQGNIWYFSVHSQYAVEVSRVLYSGSGPSLERKYKVARSMIERYEKKSVDAAKAKICSVHNCGRKKKSHDLCIRHLKRVQKHGSIHAIGTRWHGVRLVSA